ncbi:hypothetical protein pb186bvf_009851 [Paramecium bursaria]
MQISIVEQEIIEKERQQMQMEEIRSYIDMEYYQTPQPLKQKLNTFKYPNELTYKKYISKPQKIDNNQFMFVRQNILVYRRQSYLNLLIKSIESHSDGQKTKIGLNIWIINHICVGLDRQKAIKVV